MYQTPAWSDLCYFRTKLSFGMFALFNPKIAFERTLSYRIVWSLHRNGVFAANCQEDYGSVWCSAVHSSIVWSTILRLLKWQLPCGSLGLAKNWVYSVWTVMRKQRNLPAKLGRPVCSTPSVTTSSRLVLDIRWWMFSFGTRRMNEKRVSLRRRS